MQWRKVVESGITKRIHSVSNSLKHGSVLMVLVNATLPPTIKQHVARSAAAYRQLVLLRLLVSLGAALSPNFPDEKRSVETKEETQEVLCH